jgi:putative oxidoreductase
MGYCCSARVLQTKGEIMLATAIGLRQLMLRISASIGFLGPLLVRVVVGWIFFSSGKGKFENLPKVVEFFASLGIPNPEVMVPFVAGTELVCGALIMIGLFTRLAAVPLIITMGVAIATAKWGELEGLSDLLYTDEFAYVAIFLWLALAGAGAASVDALLVRLTDGAAPAPAAGGADHAVEGRRAVRG